MKNKYTRLFSKLKQHDGLVFCGYITPSEIFLLKKLGLKEIETKWPVWNGEQRSYVIKAEPYKFDYYLKQKKKGISNPHWFYFIPDENLFEKLLPYM